MNDMPSPNPKIDAEFNALCPPLSQDEAKLLEQSIEHEGCRDALVVWNGVLLDGHNRLTFCRAHDLDFETIELEGVDTRDQARNWIINN